MGTITSSRSPCHQPPPSRSSLPPLATCQQKESAPSLYEQLQLATLPIPAQELEPRNNHAAVLLWYERSIFTHTHMLLVLPSILHKA